MNTPEAWVYFAEYGYLATEVAAVLLFVEVEALVTEVDVLACEGRWVQL
jgi:hypothetical protein